MLIKWYDVMKMSLYLCGFPPKTPVSHGLKKIYIDALSDGSTIYSLSSRKSRKMNNALGINCMSIPYLNDPYILNLLPGITLNIHTLCDYVLGCSLYSKCFSPSHFF